MNTPSRLLAPAGLNDLLLYRCARLSATAGTMIVRLCEGRFGITRREWRMVAMLADAGALAPSQLAEAVQLDRARTSRAASSLVTKGLVQRSVRASDQRYALLELSAAGSALHAELFPLVAQINRELLAGFSADEVAQLQALLERLQARAELELGARALPKANRRRASATAAAARR